MSYSKNIIWLDDCVGDLDKWLAIDSDVVCVIVRGKSGEMLMSTRTVYEGREADENVADSLFQAFEKSIGVID